MSIEEENIPTKRVFLHFMDHYECNELRKHLIAENRRSNYLKYEILGSLHFSEHFPSVLEGGHPLEILNFAKDDFLNKILTCDVLIFNISVNNIDDLYFEMQKIMKTLEEYCKNAEKTNTPVTTRYILLLSTMNTWALTTLNDDSADNYLSEEDYKRRRAHKSYCKCKFLERDVMRLQKKCKKMVRTLVVCRGIPYGSGNNIFHYIFKLSFFNHYVPILKPGTQSLPVIYIKDLCRILQHIIDNFPESKIRYIFAVQPQMISLKQFTYKICKAFNEDCSKIRFLDEVELLEVNKELIPKTVVDTISINLNVKSTYFKDFIFTHITEEFWTQLADEFRSDNLHPIKIVLDGPPLVGKTVCSRILSEYYEIPYIKITHILRKYIEYLENKIKDSMVVLEYFGINDENTLTLDAADAIIKEDLERRVKFYTNEMLDLKNYYESHKDFENQEFKILSRCIIALLSKKQYNINQGYILDGFPFPYIQAGSIFFNTIRISTDSIDSLFNYKPIIPTHAVILSANDELLCKRAMSFTDAEAKIRRCLRDEMLTRLEAYRDRDFGPQCLSHFLYDQDLIPIHINEEETTKIDDVITKIKTEIGPPFNYPLSDVEKGILNDKIAEQKLKEKEEEKRKSEELKQQLQAERERKLLEWTNAYKKIREHEDEVNTIKSLSLRQYVQKYILPTLSDGMLKVAELQPDNPMDFLAEFLFQKNPIGQQTPPFCTPEQRKNFEDIMFKDIIEQESLLSFQAPDSDQEDD